MMPKPSRVAFLIFPLVLAVALARSQAQTWSYHGTSICYDSGGGSSQCYASGTIQRYATNQEQFDAQFKAGWAAGEGVGNLANALISKWAEHRRIVEQERNDLRAQLQSFGNANDELMGDLIDQMETLSVFWPKLAKYIPTISADADKTVEQYRKIAGDFTEQRAESKKNLALIVDRA